MIHMKVLGVLVSSKGMTNHSYNPSLVLKAILECPAPRSVIEVISFHGLASFYRKFIRGFSNICGPFTKTMRGDRKEFKWIVGANKSFNLLEQKVTKHPILALP